MEVLKNAVVKLGEKRSKTEAKREIESRQKNGGEGGIRTLGTGTPLNGFQDRRIQPLCHLSKAVISYRIIQFFASRGFSKLGFAS